MDILITGGTGYVGARVARRLAEGGHALTMLVRKPSDEVAAKALGASPLPLSLEDVEGLTRAAGRVDAALHGAASDNPTFMDVNRAAVMAIMAGLPRGTALVCHGGTAVFGDTGAALFDGTEDYAPPPPLGPRADLDRLVRAGAAGRGLRTAVVYGSFVYGGGRGAALPSGMIAAALRSGTSAYPGDGSAAWSAVHVDDWADLIARAVTNAPPGGNAYPASGSTVSMAWVAATIGAALRLPTASLAPEAAFDR